jgi:hypothetical protein
MDEAHPDAAAAAGPSAAPKVPLSAEPQSANRPHHPPKPGFALAVGIVGHKQKFWDDATDPARQARRQEHLQKVTADVHTALAAIKSAAEQAYHDHEALFDGGTGAAPELTLVSALADGADTIAAKAALDLGYALDAPLPFERGIYEQDFSASAVDDNGAAPLQDFHTLLGRARAVLQLPGQRRAQADTLPHGDLKENRAYEAVGLTVLSQADILLTVWDRGAPRGRGGTAEMVAEAARAGIPTVVVDANGEKPIELRWRGLTPTPAPIVAFDDLPIAALDDGIDRVVDELVRPPRASEQRRSLNDWYRESSYWISSNFGIAFPLLMTALLTRRIRITDLRPYRPDELAKQYIGDANPAVDPKAPGAIARLAEPYGWADAVGIYFAQLFRSAFVINFIFAAMAVTAASASVMARPEGRYEHVATGLEIGLILCVVANTLFGRHWRWHRRWVEAREVAERLRVALPLWTLGLRPAAFPGEEPTWTGWYVRALVRALGLRGANLAADGLATERSVLLNLLKGQCSYNHANAGRMHRVETRLELVGVCLLVATLAVALDHLFLDGAAVHSSVGHILPPREATLWLSAALPALATATYGIRVIGDFDGIHQRGERTYRQLNELITAIEQDPIDLGLLRARAGTAADAMLGDVASWRLSAESRGLAIPG